jgi:hypothetical protein
MKACYLAAARDEDQIHVFSYPTWHGKYSITDPNIILGGNLELWLVTSSICLTYQSCQQGHHGILGQPVSCNSWLLHMACIPYTCRPLTGTGGFVILVSTLDTGLLGRPLASFSFFFFCWLVGPHTLSCCRCVRDCLALRASTPAGREWSDRHAPGQISIDGTGTKAANHIHTVIPRTMLSY